MRILVVAATVAEIGPFVARLGHGSDIDSKTARYKSRGREIDVLVSGVGMVATATWCSRALARTEYGLALNLGLCGAFDRTLVPGTVVHVVSDCFSELGAEDGAEFLTVHDLGLLGESEPPFQDGRLRNEVPPVHQALAKLREVDGITVNTVHGNDESIASAARIFEPHVESMEGAAFMYACLVHGVPFAQVRAVSNIVERRNRSAWKLTEAIDSLCRTATEFLEHT